MKKIITFLSALAMMIAMSATVSFAADNEVAFTTTKTANGVDVVVSLNTTYTDIQTIGLFLDMSDAEGATITTTNGDAQLKYVAAQKMVSVAFAPSDMHKYVSGTALGTISVSGVSENFTISLMPKTSRTTSKITSVADGDLMYGSTVAFNPAAISTSVKVVEEAKTTMDTPVAGNDMYGMKTALTKISFKNVANPVVKLAKDGVDSGKTYELPSGVAGGTTDIIGIIRYAADVTGEFVLSVLDGTTEVVSTSYVAQ